jgi:quercetin 2,3-dioxygenase
MLSVKKIAESKLGVSEPPPSWFGNRENENSPKWTNANWLKSRFHFSFAEYSNPRNTNFGVLRVMNDDLVQPNRGFGEHPHRDVEICTYVVEGKLTHKDSMGTAETLSRGAIQFMTAGRGVTHSEHNLDRDSPLRFIQIWITTRQRGLTPKYGSFVGDSNGRSNKWAHLVTDTNNASSIAPIKINQDANIHVTEIAAGSEATFQLGSGRQAYLLCIEGECEVSGAAAPVVLNRHDAAEITGQGPLTVRPTQGSSSGTHCLIVEMAYSGDGRTDL